MFRFLNPDPAGESTAAATSESNSNSTAASPSTGGQSTTRSGTPGATDQVPLGGRAPSIFADDMVSNAQAQVRDRIDAIWLQIAGGGQQLLDQVRAAADQALRDFIKGIEGGVALTPEEQSDLVMATQMLAASGVLALGASELNMARLTQMRLDALSCLADIAAIKAHDGEKLILQAVARILAIGQDFVLRGVTLVATAALTG